MLQQLEQLIDVKVYLIRPGHDNEWPSKAIDQERKETVKQIQNYLPYLCHREKRHQPSRRLRRWERWRKGAEYSFRNAPGKGIEWIDYSVRLLPLLFALLRHRHCTSISEGVELYFYPTDNNISQGGHKGDLGVQWDKVLTHWAKGGVPAFSEIWTGSNASLVDYVDGIDFLYDEIKQTQLSAQSYHFLFSWFGEATVDIGYRAFDLFGLSRDASHSWLKAVEEHVLYYLNDQDLCRAFLQKAICPGLLFG